jgi:hypothetical protein
MAEQRAGLSAGRHSAAAPRVAALELDRSRAPRSAAVEWARSVRLELVAILLVAMVIRLGWVLIGAVPPESDYATFEQMATVIRSGSWWPESYGWVFQGPMYPTLLALVPALGDDGLTGARLLNTLMQGATVACVYVTARHRFGVRSGLIAAGLCALLPGMWFFTPLLAAENLAMLLLAVITLCLVLPRSSLRLVIAGAAAAGLLYARPSFLLFPVVIGMVIALFPDGMRRKSQILLFVVGLAIVGLPVANANLMAGGAVLPTGGAGWQPWLVYNERATGAWRPAQGEPDYPFAGLPEEYVAGAQRKLAIQFFLANPGASVASIRSRVEMTWASDQAGLDWTLRRAKVPNAEFTSALGLAADSLYLILLTLAFAAVVRHRKRAITLVPMIAPVAYLLVLQVISEGNGRYHVSVLPVLAVLAGGAVMRPLGNQLSALALLGALVLTASTVTSPAPWLIVAIVVVPIGLVLRDIVPRAIEWAAAAYGRNRGRTMVAAAASLLIVVGLATAAVAGVQQELAAIEAVAPQGWQGYGSSPEIGPDEIAGQSASRGSTPASGLRPVSYPESARIAFPEPARSAGVVGLTRTLAGLTSGNEYLLYLQLFDPGVSGHPSETLVIRVNGRDIWSRPPEDVAEPAWVYLALRWTADAPVATIDVERRAVGRTDIVPAEVLVRSLHLYPSY